MRNIFLLLTLGVLMFWACSKKDAPSSPASTTSTTSTSSTTSTTSTTSTSSKTCYLLTAKTGSITKTYVYDAQNKLVALHHGTAIVIYHDSVLYTGSQASQYDDNEPSLSSRNLTFAYNTDGTLASLTYYNALFSSDGESAYTYNSSKQVSLQTFTDNDTAANSFTEAYQYDANGNVVTAVRKMAGITKDSVVLQYDSKNAIYQNLGAALKTVILKYWNWGSNNPTKIVTYDSKGNILSTDNYTYTYDVSDNNVSTLSFSGNSSGSNVTYSTTYTYNCK